MLKTPAYWLFVLVGFSQLAALTLIGYSSIALAGVVFVCALVIWLGHGSRVAWWLFVLGNAVLLAVALPLVLASAGRGSFGAGVDWQDVATTVAGSSALLAILLSGRMRTSLRGGQPSGANRSIPRDSTLA